MALSTAQHSKQMEPGVWLSKGKIVSARSITGEQPEGFTRPIGIGVELELEKAGLSFKPKIRIFGEPKLDEETKAIKGWGSGIGVLHILQEIAEFFEDLPDDLTIPDKALEAMIGKEVMTLAYKSTAGKYYTWREVVPFTKKGEEDMTSRWKYSRSKGYPKDFAPFSGNGSTASGAEHYDNVTQVSADDTPF